MGKRKNQADNHKTTGSGNVPNSSQMDAVFAQHVNDSIKLPQNSLSHGRQHFINNSMLLRNPRYCSRKYSRRKSTCGADASTSHEKDISLLEEKLTLKSRSKGLSKTENQAGHKPERTRSRSLSANAALVDTRRTVCGICERPLRKKPLITENYVSLREPSVVAVLVCGHLYHADCLEQKTRQEESTDPACPMCMNFISQADCTVVLE